MDRTRSCLGPHDGFCSMVNLPSSRRNKPSRQKTLPKPGFLQKMKINKEDVRMTFCAHHHQDNNMFIFGLGYVGLALARHLHSQPQACWTCMRVFLLLIVLPYEAKCTQCCLLYYPMKRSVHPVAAFWVVSGTCSHDERRIALEEAGFRVFLFNSDNDGEKLTEEGLEAMGNATHMVVTIPPVADFDEDPVISIYKKQIFEIATRRDLQWIGYLSSTGVYGDYQGEWVDENSQAKPLDKRGIARLKAEEEWLELGNKSGACVQVFRLGGIYGPGRSAISTLLRPGMWSSKQRRRESRQYTSRIHVSDICRAIMASVELPSPGKIYNVVDDDPAPRQEVFSYARRLICEKWPSKTAESLGEAIDTGVSNLNELQSSSRRAEKRVWNARLKEDLKLELLYPSYKSGLKALIDEMGCEM